MGVANVHVHVKRTRASHFFGLATDPKLLCPIAMKLGSPKNIRVCGAFFGGRLTNILKFSAGFNKSCTSVSSFLVSLDSHLISDRYSFGL